MSQATAKYYWIDKTDRRYLHTFTPEVLQHIWARFRAQEQDARLPLEPESDEVIVNPKFAHFCAVQALHDYVIEHITSRWHFYPHFKPRGRGITSNSRTLSHDCIVLIWPGLPTDPANTYQLMGFTTDLAFKALAREVEGRHGNYYEMDEGQLLHMRDLR
jgi:hypothetical protein